MGRAVPFGLLAVLLMLGRAAAADTPAADPDLARGIEQVKAGRHEAGIETLQDVVRRTYGDPARAKVLVEAYVQLGVARVAMGDVDGARGEFDAALEHDPKLRLAPPRHPPEAVAVFEDVRRRREKSGGTVRSAQRRRTAGKAALIAGGAGAAVAGGLALRSAAQTDPIPVPVVDVQYESTSVVCPDGAQGLEVPFAIVLVVRPNVNADLLGAEVLPIYVGGITFSQLPNFPQASRPAIVAPVTRLVANQPASVRVQSTLLCTNPSGNDPAFSTWRFQGLVYSSVGRIGFATPTGRTLRMELP